jgi:hypothetical protein
MGRLPRIDQSLKHGLPLTNSALISERAKATLGRQAQFRDNALTSFSIMGRPAAGTFLHRTMTGSSQAWYFAAGTRTHPAART